MFSIVVVSMRDALSRRSLISKTLNELNLNFEFYDAVDGRSLKASLFYEKAYNSNFWFNRRSFLTPSEVGCSLSHDKVLENFITDSPFDWLVVLEDDVDLKPSFSRAITEFCSGHDSTSFDGVAILGGQEGLKSRRLIYKAAYQEYNGVLFYSVPSICHRWVYRTCGYIINKNSAKKVLQLKSNLNIVADDWSFIFKRAPLENMYLTNLVVHPESLSDSSIEQERLKSKF
ncbi:glycosyltransferase family 25 protein [Shewanella mangrovisoli]|uniref:glycosyltransferase family 25 protein n=1 Tax=Shewanella mangrovisoli TaxID=2864211 RepID=UPI0035BB480C